MQRLTTSCKQIDIQPVSRQWLPWKKTLTPPSSAASPVLLPGMTLYHMEYSFREFGSPVPAVSPPSLLPTHLLPCTVEAERETEKALMLCKHCLSIPKTLVCYQHWFSHKSKHSTIGVAMKKVKSIPARPSTFTKTFEQLHCWLHSGWAESSWAFCLSQMTTKLWSFTIESFSSTSLFHPTHVQKRLRF